MAFVLPPALLAQLRERLARQREHADRRSSASEQGRSLTDTFKSVVDGRTDTKSAAVAFVEGMNALQLEVEDQEDAFLLDPGMGPMSYLTSDGRVLCDHRSWDGDGIREASLDEAIATIVVGAKTTGIADLLRLVPAAPVDGMQCPRCNGERWDALFRQAGHEIICTLCSGRGWTTSETIESARARGMTW